MYVSAPGMVCSVGLNAEAACAAMRAGIAGFEELPYRDNNGEPIIGAMVPGLDPDLSRRDRLVEMLAMALTDTLSKAPDLRLETVPLIVCLAEPDRPGGGAEYAETIIAAVEHRLDLSFHPTLSGAIARGHVAGFLAIRHTRSLITHQQVKQCLICAADSYINASSLNWLDQHWRLKMEVNSDGVIPGEAAAAFFLSNELAQGINQFRVLGLGFDREAGAVIGEAPQLGLGLTTAARAALDNSGLRLEETHFRLTDATGEQYGFKEHALAIMRLMRGPVDDYPIWHSADSIGDTGAVAGLCQFVHSGAAFAQGYAAGARGLCFTSAVGGERAVAVVERNDA